MVETIGASVRSLAIPNYFVNLHYPLAILPQNLTRPTFLQTASF